MFFCFLVGFEVFWCGFLSENDGDESWLGLDQLWLEAFFVVLRARRSEYGLENVLENVLDWVSG